ncbi:2504_t:CDS:2, partial [Cetraspora pellucida]
LPVNTSQHDYDFDDKRGFDDEQDSDSLNEDSQDPNNPLMTSEDGVACIYNVASIDTEKALEIFDLKNIQYSYKDGTTSPELIAMTHTSVDFDNNLFKKIFEANDLSSDTNMLNNEVAQGLIQEKSGCLVKFWHYMPEDLENSIQNNLKSIITAEDILDLIARKLITHMYFYYHSEQLLIVL